ncbi:MAG: TetR/AcrR family transcriptional regulator [Salinivirgaceae bacterium]
MPRSKEQFNEIRTNRKKQIMHVAVELFANQGYFSTSMNQIAQVAQISKGLTYNYFHNKEDLLKSIILDIMFQVMDKVNPNHDSEIDDDEAQHFIENFLDVIIDNPQEWKLYFQIFIQKDVLEIILNDEFLSRLEKHQRLFFDYFANHEFDDPLIEIMLFSSIYKGFTLQYVYAPELFDKDEINRFKRRVSTLFLKPKRKVKNADISFNESIGYMLT